MFDWLKRDRCKSCQDERAIRFCLRSNKDIGWHCCNHQRIDKKCPNSCNYTPHDPLDINIPVIKADSRAELLDFLKRYLHCWVYQIIPKFYNINQQEITSISEQKQIIEHWLAGFSYPVPEIVQILNEKLHLELPIPVQTYEHYEELAIRFLEAVITFDWERAAAFFPSPNFILPITHEEKLCSLLSSDRFLRKIKRVAIINSGFTEDKKQTFVFLETNGKSNLTLIFAQTCQGWILDQIIRGTIQDFYAQKRVFEDIATLITLKQTDKCADLLYKAKDIYLLNPDIYYYLGLLHTLESQIDRASEDFLNAVVIDPSWSEPAFRLGLLLLHQKDYQQSLLWWEYLQKLTPSDPKVWNNLGVCLLGMGQKNPAKSIWAEALKIFPDDELLTKNAEL